jgi:hypothetical protein
MCFNVAVTLVFDDDHHVSVSALKLANRLSRFASGGAVVLPGGRLVTG